MNNIYKYVEKESLPKGMIALIEEYKEVIESVSREYNDGYDYWIYLKDGYICEPMECSTIHEYSIKECKRMLKEVRKVDE